MFWLQKFFLVVQHIFLTRIFYLNTENKILWQGTDKVQWDRYVRAGPALNLKMNVQ